MQEPVRAAPESNECHACSAIDRLRIDFPRISPTIDFRVRGLVGLPYDPFRPYLGPSNMKSLAGVV